MSADLVIRGGSVGAVEDGRFAVRSAAIGITGGRISFVGAAGDAPDAEETWDLEGRLVTAGLVDCHTHLVYGGDRLDDFARRVGGDSYAAIAESGGGIRTTVEATREAGKDRLVDGAVERLTWLARSGVTTVEVKSGYGLTPEIELLMLDVAVEAGALAGVEVSPTLLGAHVVPTGQDRREFVDLVCEQMIPAARGRADAFDVFIDRIAFTAAEAALMFEAAKVAGLPVKAHVGQLADIGGAQVAASAGALSIDHCEHIPESAMSALAEAGTVAVLVPGASLFLGETALPPVAGFRRHGIPMAVTTDLNPGSSPTASLPLAAALAIHRFGLTPEEAFAGITSVAAAAAGFDDRGRVEVGMRADLAVWDVDRPEELGYWLGAPICHATVVGGRRHLWSVR